MKLEIIKEEKFGESAWYALRIDEVAYKFSRNLEEIEQIYEEVKADPSLIEDKKTVLKSEEI